MTDPNIPKAMEHRLIPSVFNDGSFPMAWIGDTPTLDARREYIRAYLERRLPHGDMENQERKLRDLAERKAAMFLINDNVIEVGADQFEWLIDEMLWHAWLGYLGQAPLFPWRCPQETGEPTRISQAFERWLDVHGREGDLVQGWKIAWDAESRGAEQRHVPGSEADLATQSSSNSDRNNESEQLHQLEQQVIQLQQELLQQDEQLLQKDERIRELEERLRQEDNRQKQLQQDVLLLQMVLSTETGRPSRVVRR
ncbi:FAD-binding-3 domain-containing protein [Fusarium falciforme]|uniref:FAD-binding-3 domain-containing protein n=1 Tax=Fusarium falciforme TaxID=195108 RepID=UPI002300796B|nr:FAD-binding-3 domain-containing protein [Fusarium falciforme]WAO94285.1 FAD-binding-3 domain-containing protein [Fusarium falciforme]